MDKVDQLIERTDRNFSDYIAHIMGFDKQQIIDMSWRISVMQDVHSYLNDPDNISDEQAEYLLRFKNPLEIIADLYEWRSPDLSDMSFDIDSICRDKSAERNGYEFAEPVDEQSTKFAPEKPQAQPLTEKGLTLQEQLAAAKEAIAAQNAARNTTKPKKQRDV